MGEKEAVCLTRHAGTVRDIVLSSGTELVASASGDHLIHVSELAARGDTAAGVSVLRGHKHIVTGVSFSPDGHLLASSSFDKTLRVWSRGAQGHDWREIAEIGGHTDSVSCVSWRPSGGDGASVSRGGSCSAAGRALPQWSLITGSADRKVVLWNVTLTLSAVTGDDGGDGGLRESWALLPALRFHAPCPAGYSTQLRARDARTGTFLPDWLKSGHDSFDGAAVQWQVVCDALWLTECHLAAVTCCAWSTDGSRFVSGAADGSVTLMCLAYGEEEESVIWSAKAHSRRVVAAILNISATKVVSCSEDSNLVLFDATSGTVLQSLDMGASLALSLTWGPDEMSMLVATGGKRVKVIYMPQFEVVGSLKLPLNPHGDRKGQRVTLLSWIPRVDAPDSLVAGLAGFSVMHLPNAASVLQPSIHGLLARCGLAGKGESVGQRTGRLYRAGLYASMDTSVSTTTPSIEAKFEGYQSRWGREVAEATVEELASAWHESMVLAAGGVTARPRLPRLIYEGQTSGRDRSADGEGEDREFKVGRRFGADHSACATRDERGDDIESMSHELIRTVAEDVVGSDRAQGERVGWGTSVLEESPAVPGLKVNSSFPKGLALVFVTVCVIAMTRMAMGVNDALKEPEGHRRLAEIANASVSSFLWSWGWEGGTGAKTLIDACHGRVLLRANVSAEAQILQDSRKGKWNKADGEDSDKSVWEKTEATAVFGGSLASVWSNVDKAVEVGADTVVDWGWESLPPCPAAGDPRGEIEVEENCLGVPKGSGLERGVGGEQDKGRPLEEEIGEKKASTEIEDVSSPNNGEEEIGWRKQEEDIVGGFEEWGRWGLESLLVAQQTLIDFATSNIVTATTDQTHAPPTSDPPREDANLQSQRDSQTEVAAGAVLAPASAVPDTLALTTAPAGGSGSLHGGDVGNVSAGGVSVSKDMRSKMSAAAVVEPDAQEMDAGAMEGFAQNPLSFRAARGCSTVPKQLRGTMLERMWEELNWFGTVKEAATSREILQLLHERDILLRQRAEQQRLLRSARSCLGGGPWGGWEKRATGSKGSLLSQPMASGG